MVGVRVGAVGRFNMVEDDVLVSSGSSDGSCMQRFERAGVYLKPEAMRQGGWLKKGRP